MIYYFYFTIIITACTNYFKGLLNTEKGHQFRRKNCRNCLETYIEDLWHLQKVKLVLIVIELLKI